MPNQPIEDLAEGIRAHALGAPDIQALLSDDELFRWYGATLEQNSTLPAVTVQQISGADAAETHQGHSGLEVARYQITVWSTCRPKLVQLTWAINRRFHNFRGRMGGIEVQRAAKLGQMDMGQNGPRNAYMRALDFSFLYRPPL